jgi:cytochrome c553
MRSLIAAMLLACTLGSASSASMQERLAACFACHGEKGQSDTPEVPSLGAQQPAFLLIQLYMFREKMRKVEPMNEMAKDLTDDDLRAMSDTIAKLPAPLVPDGPIDPARMERGRKIGARNRCNFCHAPNYAGQDQVPRLAAQREDYLLKALRDYKSGARIGYDISMIEVVRPLGDQDFADLAYYLAWLP